VHPDPELLVRFAEAPDSLPALERSALEGHVAVCGECAQEIAFLEAVDGEEPVAETPPIHIAVVRSSDLRARLSRLWEILAATVLRPFPASLYLAAAATAILLLLLRPGGDLSPQTGPGEISPLQGTTVGSVVVLPDQGDRVRGEEDEGLLPAVHSQQAQFLLLEFTNLVAPPQSEELYSVELVEDRTAQIAWQRTVKGESFADNYALYVFLQSGILEPGRYMVRVKNLAGEVIFHSSLDAR
jgi:hypothetical protein